MNVIRLRPCIPFKEQIIGSHGIAQMIASHQARFFLQKAIGPHFIHLFDQHLLDSHTQVHIIKGNLPACCTEVLDEFQCFLYCAFQVQFGTSQGSSNAASVVVFIFRIMQLLVILNLCLKKSTLACTTK